MQCGHLYVSNRTMNFFLDSHKWLHLIQRKETETKSVGMATSKYAQCGVFHRAQHFCQVLITLCCYLQRYY